MIDFNSDGTKEDATVSVEVDIQKSGILAHINRVAFHPLGLALAYDPDNKNFYLLGDGAEPWSFQDDNATQDRYDAFWRLMKRVRKS